MNDYAGKDVKNVVLLGHSGAGKTAILESMLYNAKIVDRFGRNVDNTSIIDNDAEEVKRGMSVYMSLVPVEWNNKKINFIDTPGYVDFAGEQTAGLAVAESAVIVVNAKDGVQSGTMKAFRQALSYKLPVFFFIAHGDEENANFEKTVDELVAHCHGLPFVRPVFKDKKLIGSVNVITEKSHIDGVSGPIPEEMKAQVTDDNGKLREAIAMTDDELTEKFFSGEPFNEAESIKGMGIGMANATIHPIICGSATANIGISDLLDAIVAYAPSYTDEKTVKAYDGADQEIEISTAADAPFSAFVFKTVADAFAQISYLKITSGTLTVGTPAYNVNKEASEKIGSVLVMRGSKQLPVTKLESGDIGAVIKLDDTSTNDTLATKTDIIKFKPIVFPSGMLGKAIWPKTKNDEDKMSVGLAKVQVEDKSCKVINNKETHEIVLYGIGDQHIDVIINKLRNRYKLEVTMTEPRVQYRETIRGKAEVEGKHKKQSGGAGQYGDVWIRFEPNPDQEEMVFAEEVFGGSVPRQYYPAVETGLRECMQKGVLAGYKVVNVKATLYDGSFHPVDSKEIAFKMAAHKAYKAGMPLAKPALLEPILKAEVTVPTDYVGSIYGDFSKRRGLIMEQKALDDETTVIVAEVPQAEMMNYATELRSMTQGNGSYVQEFVRYDFAPAMIADKVIAAAKADMKEEEEE